MLNSLNLKHFFNYTQFYAGYCVTVGEIVIGKINYPFILSQLVLAIHGCHMLFLLAYEERMPPLVNYAQFNYMFIVGFHRYGNAIFFAFICLAMVHCQLTYRHNVGSSAMSLQNILLRGKSDFFIWNTCSIEFIKRKNIQKLLLKLAGVVRNSLHIFHILNGKAGEIGVNKQFYLQKCISIQCFTMPKTMWTSWRLSREMVTLTTLWELQLTPVHI